MKRIAIIPARSGSKGLKDKNIKELNGVPLIAYTINAAIESKMFDTIFVSTDSERYASIAKKYKAEVPFLRSLETASDTASSWDVVKEVINNYKKQGVLYDEVALLQPTSPLRTKEDIISAYKIFNEKKADSVVSVCEVNHPIQWCFKLDETFSMKDFCHNKFKNFRRQELEKNYMENGAIYLLKVKNLMQKDFDFYSDNSFAYVMNNKNSIDIDEELDFKIAEILLQRNI